VTSVTTAIPITLLTGYLGSGKTTLLSRLLAHAELKDTAVLVNEFGEIALDHQLLYSAAESIVLMDRGCLCCALRADLAEQLDELYSRRMRKDIPQFKRVIIETTGLADPAPILQTLVSEPMLAALYRLDGVVTTVDGELGDRELDEHFESVKQVAAADRIVMTKADRTDEAALAALETRLRTLNPAAQLLRANHGLIDPELILNAGLYAADGQFTGVERWLKSDRYRLADAQARLPFERPQRHDQRIRSFAIVYDQPVSGTRLWQGLEALIGTSGDKLLRVKGIVNVMGQLQPRVIHIVQHVLYPVTTLPAWPDEDRRTRLVFIVRDLDLASVQCTLRDAGVESV
jgi:G3E family GTPase